MASWRTKDSHNETLSCSGNPTGYCLRTPTTRSPKSSNRYSYASPCGYPTPTNTHNHSDAYSQPCASDKTYEETHRSTGSRVVIASGGYEGKGAASNRCKVMGKHGFQGGSLFHLQPIDRHINWQVSSRRTRNLKEIPLGDGIHGQGSAPRSH